MSKRVEIFNWFCQRLEIELRAKGKRSILARKCQTSITCTPKRIKREELIQEQQQQQRGRLISDIVQWLPKQQQQQVIDFSRAKRQ